MLLIAHNLPARSALQRLHTRPLLKERLLQAWRKTT